MSARDELAKDIPTWTNLPFGGRGEFVKLDANSAYAIAGVLSEKGYRKPRTITTLSELEDLAEGSVVLDPLETVAICIGRDLWTMGGDEYSAWELASDWFTLPATVLYEPTA